MAQYLCSFPFNSSSFLCLFYRNTYILPSEPLCLNQRNFGLPRLELYRSCLVTLCGSLVDWCWGSFTDSSTRIAGRSLPIRNIANGSSFCPAGLIFMDNESLSSSVSWRVSLSMKGAAGLVGASDWTRLHKK